MVSLALLFLFRPLFPAPSSFFSSSFPFPIFLFPLYLYLLFVFFFHSFLLSFLRSSLLLLLFFRLPPTQLPPPPPLFPLFPLLSWSVFSFFSPSPSSSPSPRLILLSFLLVFLSILLFLFSLLLSSHTVFYSASSPLPSSSSAYWVLSFFVFSSSIGRFFLPSVVHFHFSLLFSPSVCIPPRFLLSSALPLVFLRGCFLLVFPLLDPPPPSSALSADSLSLFFAFPPILRFQFALLSSLCFGLPPHSYSSLPLRVVASCYRGGSLSLPLMSFSGVGYLATGLPLRLGSLLFVVFSLATPASFSMSQRVGLRCLCFPPSGVYFLSFVVISKVYIASSVFRLLSSVPPVSWPCFAVPVDLVTVVSCCSVCCLAFSIAFLVV